jgi:hypothetical protein
MEALRGCTMVCREAAFHLEEFRLGCFGVCGSETLVHVSY